jgi:hypothetical protein
MHSEHVPITKRSEAEHGGGLFQVAVNAGRRRRRRGESVVQHDVLRPGANHRVHGIETISGTGKADREEKRRNYAED